MEAENVMCIQEKKDGDDLKAQGKWKKRMVAEGQLEAGARTLREFTCFSPAKVKESRKEKQWVESRWETGDTLINITVV